MHKNALYSQPRDHRKHRPRDNQWGQGEAKGRHPVQVSVSRNREPQVLAVLWRQWHMEEGVLEIYGRHPCAPRQRREHSGQRLHLETLLDQVLGEWLEVEKRAHSAVLLGDQEVRAVVALLAWCHWRQGLYGGFGAQGVDLF